MTDYDFDFEKLRLQMVDEQIIPRGIKDDRVLEAMRTVPREKFVHESLREGAYQDGPLPIGYRQTISQPFTVAFLAEALQLSGDEKILELGTGCGYQAAVLSCLAGKVITLERIPELAQTAAVLLNQLGYQNVQVILANGTLGYEQEAPFDAILATASSERLPKPLLDQLSPGGRIVIPLGTGAHAQRLFRFTLEDGQLQEEDLGGFAFVPLIGEEGWSESEIDNFRER